MGIKSTYNINRQTALTVIFNKLSECTDKQLENILLDFKESYFRNYKISDAPIKNHEDNLALDRNIKTLDDFNNLNK